MAEKKKFYVVWKGVKPGVYNTWSECEQQIKGFVGALYKSYPSLSEAEKAFSEKPHLHLQSKSTSAPKISSQHIIKDSLSVDGACSGSTGNMEYRCVHTGTGQLVFSMGPYKNGTNNIAEFLALVHAISLCKLKGWTYPIYSDSRTAMAWLKKKKANTKCEQDASNDEIFDLLQRAEKWLNANSWTNPVLKWETDQWGEIPADFGRK